MNRKTGHHSCESLKRVAQDLDESQIAAYLLAPITIVKSAWGK
jgi:hypothetical protein